MLINKKIERNFTIFSNKRFYKTCQNFSIFNRNLIVNSVAKSNKI